MIRLQLPLSDYHSQVRVTINHPMLQIVSTLDNSHRHLDIDLPAGADESELEILAQFCGRNGEPDPATCTMILKERIEKSVEEKETDSGPQPEAEPKAEPTPEPDATVEPDRVSEPVDQSASGEQPSVADPAGDDQPAVSVPDGVAQSEGGVDAGQVGEAAQSESDPQAGSLPAIQPVKGKKSK